MHAIKISLLSLLSALVLVACGDGSVRSPDRFGSGALVSMELRCQTPSGAECTTPNTVAAGAFVNYRVIGTFEDGSQADITDLSRITFPQSAFIDRAGAASLTPSGPDKGRVRGNRATEPGAPVIVVARDTEGEASDASASLAVTGSIPTGVSIFRDSGCTQSANGLIIPSGTPQQFFARIDNNNPNQPSQCVAQDPRLVWSADPANNPDGSNTINADTGNFVGQNTDPVNDATFTITATVRPVPNDPDSAQFDPVDGSADVTVTNATFVPGSLRLEPAAATIPIGGTQTFTAFGTFNVGQGETVEVNITQVLSGLTSDAPAFADFQPSPQVVDNVLLGIQETPQASPVTITASAEFEDEDGNTVAAEDTASVTVLEADFGALGLVPVGVAPYEEAGLFNFPDLSEEEVQELRDLVARNALRLGTNEDGQVPTCLDDGTPCPNGALDRHQTLPTVRIAYAVVAFPQGDDDRNEGVLLNEFNVQCDDGRVLEVNIDGGDDVVSVQTEVALPGTGEMVPARTGSGVRIVLVEGLTEGVSTLRARLGADFDGSAESGFNCRSTVEDPEPVEDAEQDVRVGFVDDTGNPVDITQSSFNINKNFACVGFTNASDLASAQDIDGADKLLSALVLDREDGERVLINMNQSAAVNFRTAGGPAATDGEGCRNDPDPEDPDAEPAPEANIDITNGRAVGVIDPADPALGVERGIVTAQGATGLDNECAAADFTPTQDPPNFTGTRTRGATYVVLPVDDDILRGDNAISDDEFNELCDQLGPLLTLQVGPLFGFPAGSGLPTELIGLLDGLLGPILANETIEGPVSDGLETVLNGLSDGLGLVLDATTLDQLVGPLTDLLGLTDGGQEPVDGATLLPTVTEGLQLVLEQLEAGIEGASGAPPEPETANPGDPFEEGQQEEAMGQ